MRAYLRACMVDARQGLGASPEAGGGPMFELGLAFTGGDLSVRGGFSFWKLLASIALHAWQISAIRKIDGGKE